MSEVRMKSIILKEDEVVKLLETGVLQFERPVKHPTIHRVVKVNSYKQQTEFDLIMDNGSGTIISCPYGIPDERRYVRETWGVGSRPDPSGGYDGIEYRADTTWDDGYGIPCYHVDAPDDVELCDYRGGWLSPVTMPKWASRLKIEVVTVTVKESSDGFMWIVESERVTQ